MPGAFSSKRNILFDLDGTLVNSTATHARAYVEALRLNFPALAAGFKYGPFAGRPTKQVLASLGLTGTALEETTGRKQQLYREAFDKGEVKPFPGMLEMLARLGESGRRLFLVSGASRVSVERTLNALNITNVFAGVIAAEDAKMGKPSAGPYLATLRNYALNAADCLAIEDAENGVRSAQEANVEVVLIHTDLQMEGVLCVRDSSHLMQLILG